MPELPDIEVYLAAFRRILTGRPIDRIAVRSPFILRTYEPDLFDAVGQRILGFERCGKRIIWQIENGWYLVFHLMIAGRFHWRPKRVEPKGKNELLGFGFGDETLMLTEASQKKRASLHVVADSSGLLPFRSPGKEPDAVTQDELKQLMKSHNHTLKRFLTDPRILSGIGNAYSDEILHRARLSPVKWTSRLTDEETARLHDVLWATLEEWKNRLLDQAGDRFPEKVTAFHHEMSVHGKFRQPCPECGTPIQRIRYASRETNYCPRCQTDGKILADRSLSRLLKDDWPKTIEELEDSNLLGTDNEN